VVEGGDIDARSSFDLPIGTEEQLQTILVVLQDTEKKNSLVSQVILKNH
jgi:hypothetical protein